MLLRFLDQFADLRPLIIDFAAEVLNILPHLGDLLVQLVMSGSEVLRQICVLVLQDCGCADNVLLHFLNAIGGNLELLCSLFFIFLELLVDVVEAALEKLDLIVHLLESTDNIRFMVLKHHGRAVVLLLDCLIELGSLVLGNILHLLVERVNLLGELVALVSDKHDGLGVRLLHLFVEVDTLLIDECLRFDFELFDLPDECRALLLYESAGYQVLLVDHVLECLEALQLFIEALFDDLGILLITLLQLYDGGLFILKFFNRICRVFKLFGGRLIILLDVLLDFTTAAVHLLDGLINLLESLCEVCVLIIDLLGRLVDLFFELPVVFRGFFIQLTLRLLIKLGQLFSGRLSILFNRL